MFEDIHFSRTYSLLDLKSEEIPIRSAQKEELLEKEELRGIDFHIHGKVLAMQSVPMLPENRQRYLYLQDFSYMVTDTSYYSRQSHYQSYQLLYTYSGTAEMIYQEKTWQLSAGTLFLCDCTKPRSLRCTCDLWESSDLHFYGGYSVVYFHEFFEQHQPLFSIPNQAAFQERLETVLKHHSGSSLHREWLVSAALENLLLYLLSVDESVPQNIPERIQNLIIYMENNYHRALSVDELAGFAGLSKYYLSREFHKFTGYSPYAYLTEIRLEKAKSMLRETDLPASRIALLSGFSDEVNFAKLFKKREGCTPGEFRKANQT